MSVIKILFIIIVHVHFIKTELFKFAFCVISHEKVSTRIHEKRNIKNKVKVCLDHVKKAP